MAFNPLRGVTSMIKSQFSKIKSKLSISRNLQKLSQQITKFVQKIFKLFMKKPSSKEDYIKIMGVYFSKRFVAIGSIIFIVFIFVFIKYIFPWAEGNLWTPTILINSEKYSTFSGKAKVVDDNGNVIYIGEMEDGKITGNGKQYDINGNLIYDGAFEDSQYSGQGKLYSNGVLIYDGAFANSQYEGEGILYNQNGKLIYSGSFSVGQRSGKGMEYNPSTSLKIYYGDFANDFKEGNGIAYANDGKTVIYEGEFSAGDYEGSGSLYENSILKYNGEFSKGLFNGQGTLYNISTKKILYQGEFVNGLYEGNGTLYDDVTEKVVYEGEFLAGKKDGQGTSYDKLGVKTFSGSFKEGTIDYISYLGKSIDDVESQFGNPTYNSNVMNREILTYVSLDVSLIFEEDYEGQYACEKIVMGMKEPFKGISSTSSQQEIQSILGDKFSSSDFALDRYYDTVFLNLSIGLNSSTSTHSQKFIMNNSYYIRLYYDLSSSKILSIEVGNI